MSRVRVSSPALSYSISSFRLALDAGAAVCAANERPWVSRSDETPATNQPGSISLPLFDRFGSVHEARLKQQGRRLPLFIFEIVTSTRRLRVSEFWVALTQRTHSQRAIGVIALQRSWTF